MKEEQDQAKQNKVEVNFWGKKEHHEIAALLKKADVFVLPSLNEGMSNSVLEAMACGLPIIATDTGGTAELIKNNGAIVEKGSVESLRLAVDAYIKDRGLVYEQGVISRNLAMDLGWEIGAIKYLELYGVARGNF